MARYRYTAVSLDGRTLAGETAADSEAAVAADFGGRGLMLTSLDRLKGGDGRWFAPAPKQRAVTTFLSELSLMLRSGLPLDEALDLARGGLPSGLARIVAVMRADVLAGSSFVQALEKYPQIFSKDVVAMARVADATGNLEGVFEAVAAQRERAHRLADKIIGALRYPAFLVVAALCVLGFFLVHVIPQFAGLFTDAATDPGALVRGMLAVSGWLTTNEVAVAAALAGFLLAALVAWRAAPVRGALSSAFLRFPAIAGVWRLWRTSRFLSSLSVLLGQGVPLTEALRVLEDVVGFDRRAALRTAGDGVRRGERLHDALDGVNLLPPVAIRMVRIGEETGELARVSGEAGQLFARHLEKRLDAITGLVGPVAILLIAALIGGLMVTIMTALVSVNQAVF